MDAEHIVIGSGLSALGTVMGLRGKGRVIVLAGDPQPKVSYYDERATVPCAHLGTGGLGNDWHGVIPVSLAKPDMGVDAESFCALFEHFYPAADIRGHVGQSLLFVPWRPIRPWRHLQRIAASEPNQVKVMPAVVSRLDIGDASACVTAESGTLRARHVWLAAGTLQTPKILAASFGDGAKRVAISDHATFYVGQISGVAPPRVIHKRAGIYFQAWRPAGADALYTLRPARFKFRQLDFGIEQRAVFGMPTGGAIAKIMRRMSPGLLSEAFYNRFGIFRRAGTYSVYAQARTPDAYGWSQGQSPIRVDKERIEAAARRVLELQPFEGLTPSKRMDIFIPGIHLHHSVDSDFLARQGIGAAGDAVRVVDPSVVDDIGAEHHSFKVLVSAYLAARRSGPQVLPAAATVA